MELVSKLKISKREYYTIIDAKYFTHLNNISKWCIVRGYIRSSNKVLNKRLTSLSRYIMILEGHDIIGKEIDHINRNKLDNRVNNLRIATRHEQIRNRGKQNGTSSQYIGVYWHKKAKKWVASIRNEYSKRKHIGSYNNEEDAARAYDRELRKLSIREDIKVYNFLND